MSYIYVIENTATGAAYIGKANDVQHRWKEHVELSKTSEKPLYRSMRKHGIDKFVIYEVDSHPDEDYVLNVLETEWIVYAKSMGVRLYNLTDGGDGLLNYRHAEEARAKIGRAHKGKTISEEARSKISKSLTGSHVSEETKQKISSSLAGRAKPEFSEEHKKKISEAKKGKRMSQDARESISRAMKASSAVGHPIDEETRQKIADKLRGQVQSQATRDKRSASVRAAWARKKASLLESPFLVETALLDPEDSTQT